MTNLTSHVRTLRSYLALRRLRRRAWRTPRLVPGKISLAGFDVEYLDLLSCYMEFKDIFVQRIYHFEARTPAPVVIDGGGCIGMSLLYWKKLYPAARVTCFEPDEAAFRVLGRNVTTNGLTEVQLVKAGLTDKAGEAKFCPDGSDGGKISDTGALDTLISTVCLSDYLADEVDFVKLNIEGQELPVLQEVEARGRLRNVRELVLEYHGWPGGKQCLGGILDLLDRNGFRYLVHDFDAETCAATKPPFRLTPQTTWFCLVYATRL